MVIAPSDEVVIRPADVRRGQLPGSSLSRRYAIVITLQTKRRLRFGAPRKKPNLYFQSFYLIFGVVKDSGCPRPGCGPSGNPRTGGATAYRAPSNFRCWPQA